MRLARASSSSGGAVVGRSGGAAGADSARARRWASIYDARSSNAGRGAGVGAVTGGGFRGTATGGATGAGGATGVRRGALGAGRLSAMTGGAGGGGATAIGGRGFTRGAGGGARDGDGGMIRRGIRFTTNGGNNSRCSNSSGDRKRICGSHLLKIAACTMTDTAIANQIVGSIAAWRLV